MALLLTRKVEVAGDPVCPDPDVYTLELAHVGDVMQVPDFNDPTIMKDRIRLDFRVVDYNYDPEPDEDGTIPVDWNGTAVNDIYSLSLHSKSKLYPVLVALRGGEDIEEGDDVELADLIGNKMKATVKPKPSGWPTISEPMAIKRRRQRGNPMNENPGF